MIASKGSAGWLVALVTAGFAGSILASGAPAVAQDRGREGRGEGRSQSRDRDSRGDRDRGERRERGPERSRFTRSQEGRHFDNGVALRRGEAFTDRHWERYFPHHYYSYPHYAANRGVSIDVVFSPFHFYYGVFPPYIHRSHVLLLPPRVVYIEVPVYVGGEYRGYGRDDYYLHRGRDDDRWKDNVELRRAVYDLQDAFREEDIEALTQLIDPKVKIAIFSKGHFEYSIEPNDYLDMSRDFMRTSRTSGFEISRVHRKSSDVYQVFARHTYRDQDDHSRTVYLCTVLERIEGRWTITQIDTSPDRIEG